MDNEQIGKILIDAVHEVFETLVYAFPEEGPSEQATQETLESEIFSAVHLSGGAQGTIAMLCARKTAEALAKNMLGAANGQLGAGEVFDSAGEIVNMVAGQVKTRFVDAGLDLKLSIPDVASSKEPAPRLRGDGKTTRVDFLVDGEPVSFVVTISEGPAS